ncbi:hypothetical protein [Thalassovita aquimarina]|uniref:Lipoprotein n=1 Tax=Thalassovita aquimarina TaxID=2785917 RepID=A0ABS5HLZ1_9RHOB|nr:hypothetical protein [Thalassovita aquimarina]MBR9649826.1 hypothetical protein [Thalassovita aquimarina]
MSRSMLFTLAAVAVLAGCAPLGLYYREGVAVSRMNNDLTDCQVSALQKVPVVKETRFTPLRMVPVRRCDASGANCIVTYELEGGDPYTVDVNKRLRKRVEAQCMTRKGYEWVELPPCPSTVANAAPKSVTTVLPRLTPESCSIQRGGGRWQIVTPG